MNYLKKKIKAHKKAIEDDEDWSDYIPAVPPHPDDLLKNQQNLASPFAINNDFYIPQSDQSTSTPDNDPSKPQPKFVRKPREEKEEWKFFEQLTARVQQTVAKSEKELEKIKATTKVDEIEAKTEKEYYFAEELENLNQQFEEKFSSLETDKKRSKSSQIKSPSVALNLSDKLKTSPSNPQIVSPVQSTPTSLKSFQTSLTASTSSNLLSKKNVVASTTSQWIGFNRDSVEILDDEDDEEERLRQEAEEAKKQKEEEEEEERKRREEEIKRRLKEDFGFTVSISSENVKDLDKIIDYEKEYLDDPFDTEFAEKKFESTKDLTEKIEKLEKELSSTRLNQLASCKPTVLDLSGNTSSKKQIDRTTSSQNIKDYDRISNKYSSVPCSPGEKIEPDEIDILTTLETGRLSRYNSKESLALSEQQISRTNSVQSIHSILSNQSRRSSTNPFDIEIDTNDQAENDDVPNVIAALTEDFCKTIGNLDNDEILETSQNEVEKSQEVDRAIDSSIEVKETDKKLKDNTLIEQINEEKLDNNDNDLSKVEDELSQEVVVNSDYNYIVEEADEDRERLSDEESLSQQLSDQIEIAKDDDSIENLNENLNETTVNVLNELSFDELGNIKCDFSAQLPEFDERDIKEVQNFIKEQIPFDPFETIVEDDNSNNSNRQSTSSPINDLSIIKQDSLDKDSAFKEDLPSKDGQTSKSELSDSTNNCSVKIDQQSELIDSNDLNNNSRQLFNQTINQVSNTSENNSLSIDGGQLKEYFDPFKTVNDLTPTSEVFTGGEDQSDIQVDLNQQNEDYLPPPPAEILEQEDHDLPVYNPDLEDSNTQLEMTDIDDLPPPPAELTGNEGEDPENVIKADSELSSNLPEPIITIEETEEDKENLNETNVEQTLVEADETNEAKNNVEIAEKEENQSSKILSDLNLDGKAEAAITSEELAELVVDPFDTAIYNYDTLKTFLPTATKDQMQEFNEKFDKKETDNDKDPNTYLDPFQSPLPQRKRLANKNRDGFDKFDPFQSTRPPKNTPVMKRKEVKIKKTKSTSDTEEEEDESSAFSSSSDDEHEKLRFVIRARMKEDIEEQENIVIPLIPPPPMTPTKSPKHQLRGVYNKPLLQVGRNRAKLREEYKRIHKKSLEEDKEDQIDLEFYANLRKKYEEEHPECIEEPLFEEDTSELEEYDNPYENLEWNFYVRYPIKKKITGNRFWKLATVKFLPAINTVQLFNYVPKSNKPAPAPEDCAEPEVSEETTGEPLQELLLQGSYNVSEIASQQYDEFGKIFTIKLQYKFYREKAAADTGKKIAHNMKIFQGKIANFTKKFNDVVNVNVNNMVDLTNKDNLLVAAAMLQHTPQITELFKFGCHNYEHLRQFKAAIEQTLFSMPLNRDRALTYKAEEMQIQMQDEYYCELNRTGTIQYHKARVRLFLLTFLNGMPAVEIGINDRTREGKEIVGRNDIMPIETEEWIRVENVVFHSCVDQSAWRADDKLVKLVPPDACTIEVMRFRVRPSRNRELPLLVSARMIINPRKVELRFEAMAAGASTKNRDAENVIPCEDIVIRIAIPTEWCYFFRVEKHTRFGSVKSASRRPGKIKGIERILGATTNIPLESSTLLEASAGQAKYEHAFRSLVWRIPRLPKYGQGAYREQICTMKLPLTENFDKIPENLDDNVYVEYNMPATTISHAVVRSVSISQSDSDTPPEKYASYVSKINYKLKCTIEHETDLNPYLAVTASAIKKPIQETPIEEKDSDDDIDFNDEEEEEE